MVKIGGKPMLWHIMKIYGSFGHKEFILALGYKGEVIREYFLNYYSHSSDVIVDLGTGEVRNVNPKAEDWLVQLIHTGRDTLTGGRLHRLEPQLRSGGTFMLTYGDGVADIDLNALLTFHRGHGRLATITAVRPQARFGSILFEADRVREFKEKPQTGEGWINGGFFVFEPGVFDYLHGDATVLEEEPLENLARDDQLMAYKHNGGWHCMDTLRDLKSLEAMWQKDQAFWKIWDNL